MKPNFTVELLPEVIEFLENLDDKTKNLLQYQKGTDGHDKVLFSKLNRFIWEFRILYNNKIYRLFSFWDKTENKEALVVGTHGILKKTQKTPAKEIKKAEEIRRQYLEHKYKKK